MSAALLAVIGAVWALPQSALAAPDRPTGLTAECSHEDSLEQLQEAKREEPIHKHGGEAQCDHGTSLTRELIREEKTPL